MALHLNEDEEDEEEESPRKPDNKGASFNPEPERVRDYFDLRYQLVMQLLRNREWTDPKVLKTWVKDLEDFIFDAEDIDDNYSFTSE